MKKETSLEWLEWRAYDAIDRLEFELDDWLGCGVLDNPNGERLIR